MLVELELNEIDVKDDNVRIRLSRGMNSGTVVAAAPVAQAAPVVPVVVEADIASDAIAGNEVPSPMVGTVYLSPAPDALPYVSVGSKVKKGETILIIEAMKTMNHIPAPQSGTIAAILVEDKQPVEFGEALVIIE